MFEERIQELTSYKESLTRQMEECKITLSSLQKEIIACDAILQEYTRIKEKSQIEQDSTAANENTEVKE